MKVREVLEKLNLGNSVAEFDINLQKYFLETQIYRDFVNDIFDIVSGDKGTGKTAIYRIVKDRYREIPELEHIEIISGFNDTGNPVFQRLSQAEVLTEGKYITVWKSYILSLLGNYVLDICEGSFTHSMKELDKVLIALGLRTRDTSALTIFSMITNLLKRVTNPSSAEVKITITDAGMPVIIPRLEFADIVQQDVGNQKIINNEDALGLLNKCVAELGINIWMILDRLDEAFAGFPVIEIPVLRALLRTYLDIQAFDCLKLKLFVRNDLFRKITQGGFVNLTHINAKRVQIIWTDEDIYNVLCQRLRSSEGFISVLGFPENISNETLFPSVFPKQVDVGNRKPSTWKWILARIMDGNALLPPRNLIDLLNKAKETQARREERAPREYSREISLFEADSLRKALAALSDQRVQDTLLAESGYLAQYIEAFRNGKAEHNVESIKRQIGLSDEESGKIIQELKAIGFLGTVGESYKIPMLYRGGLNITQGKAYS
jgi:hypothetical protein